MEMADTASLRLSIERSLTGAFDPADVLPRLARLARLAPEGSDDGVFAHQRLAELVVDRDPWRAALYIRRALAHRSFDDRPWAILAFCQTLLGNFRCAVSAYERAIARAPTNPTYAHNLGHLLDVALGQPEHAVPWLRAAHEAKRENTEIVASFAHALGRAGKLVEARALVVRALATHRGSRELEALLVWIDDGAPKRARDDRHGPAQKGDAPRRTRRVAPSKHLARELERGLANLPLDARQRQRAMTLARDAGTPAAESGRPVAHARRAPDVAATAAAIAYAIVYIDHMPLSPAEVAAPFRIGVAELRGRFAELRAKLDIIRGDARYASARR